MLVDHEEVVRLVEHAQPLQIVVSCLVLRPVQHQLHVFRQLPVAHTPKLLFYLRGAEGSGQGSDLAKKKLTPDPDVETKNFAKYQPVQSAFSIVYLFFISIKNKMWLVILKNSNHSRVFLPCHYFPKPSKTMYASIGPTILH